MANKETVHFYRVVERAGAHAVTGVGREKAIRLYCEQRGVSWLLQVRGPRLNRGGLIEGKAFMIANAWMNREDLIALRNAIESLLQNDGGERRRLQARRSVMGLNKVEVRALKEVRERIKMKKASFGRVSELDDDPLPKSEKEVTEFIRRRTRLYMETWVLPVIDQLIAEAEGKKVYDDVIGEIDELSR